jgi:hypothetical protein
MSWDHEHDDEDEDNADPTTRERWNFVPRQLDRTVIAIPLLDRLEEEDHGEREPEPHAIVMELNLEHSESRAETRRLAERIVDETIERSDEREDWQQREHTDQYLFASLWGPTIRAIVAFNEKVDRPIYRIWPDFQIGPL